MNVCAPVPWCSTWATAAAAATTDLDIDEGRLNVRTAEGLTRWLQQHGKHLEALTVAPGTDLLPALHLLQLPCRFLTRLCVLQLHDCRIELQRAGGSTLLLPALQVLSLRRVKTCPNSLASLQMPQLTYLEPGFIST